MGMEESVIYTEESWLVGMVHGGRDIRTITYGPVEVLVPVGRVRTADIGYSTTTAVGPHECLREADGLVELGGKAAVSNHDAAHAVIGHKGYLLVVELRAVPSVIVAVGGIVNESDSRGIEVADGLSVI